MTEREMMQSKIVKRRKLQVHCLVIYTIAATLTAYIQTLLVAYNCCFTLSKSKIHTVCSGILLLTTFHSITTLLSSQPLTNPDFQLLNPSGITNIKSKVNDVLGMVRSRDRAATHCHVSTTNSLYLYGRKWLGYVGVERCTKQGVQQMCKQHRVIESPSHPLLPYAQDASDIARHILQKDMLLHASCP